MTSTTKADHISRQPPPARQLAVVLFWLAVWQGLSWVVGRDFLLAPPLQVARALVTMVPSLDFWATIWHTFTHISLGFLAGCVIGVLGALAASLSPLLDALFTPLISGIRSVPVVSFIILILLWAGSAQLGFIISFLMVLPVIYINVTEGLATRSKELHEVALVFDIPLGKRLLGIDLLQVYPFFLSGAKLALGLAWKSGISGEVIGITAGSIGERLYQAKILLSSADLFAWTIVIIALSYSFEKLVRWLLGCGEKALIKGWDH